MIKKLKNRHHFFMASIALFAAIFACHNTKGNDKNTDSITNTLNKLKDVGVAISLTDVNKLSNEGKKNGIWVSESEFYIQIEYYNNGMKDGVGMWYNNLMTPIGLSGIVSYKQGKLYEIIDFGGDGVLSYIIQDIRLNDKFPEFKGLFKYVGYSKSYKQGKLCEEGYILFDEDWEMDCGEIGEWKIYDDNGDYTIENKWPVGYNFLLTSSMRHP